MSMATRARWSRFTHWPQAPLAWLDQLPWLPAALLGLLLGGGFALLPWTWPGWLLVAFTVVVVWRAKPVTREDAQRVEAAGGRE
jgi:hypothetical protein